MSSKWTTTIISLLFTFALFAKPPTKVFSQGTLWSKSEQKVLKRLVSPQFMLQQQKKSLDKRSQLFFTSMLKITSETTKKEIKDFYQQKKWNIFSDEDEQQMVLRKIQKILEE